MRDECRGAHYKPEFAIPGPDADDAETLRVQAKTWCRAFKEKKDKWLKSTVVEHSADGPKFSYEEVDTSLIPPRPRTYGLKGAEIIDLPQGDPEFTPQAEPAEVIDFPTKE